jgi:NADPH-dependent glutamate synthase beta subunit-like oxidoreductase/formate hydrogenlyase subunit 6/NADH:ubiquinone oxidoreductase subunit I/ferredoxin
MAKINLTIDGKSITADSENTVLEAANQAGIYIPQLCSHPDLKPSGECGLCAVEIEGSGEPVQACNTKVSENMVVHTDNDSIRKKQKLALEKILKQHPNACLTCWRRERCKPYDVCLRNVEVTERCVTCPENTHCELQQVVDFLDMGNQDIPYTYRNLPVQRDNPYFDLDYNLCIACGRCVRACRDLRGIKALDFKEIDGFKVAGPVKATYEESGCKYCFTCVEVCPVGALVDKQARYRAIAEWEGYVVPCSYACPAHIDIPRYVNYIARGKYPEALAVVREKVPFPGALGRVCIHPCEQACRRSKLNQPVCIKFLKRYAADHDNEMWKKGSKMLPPTGKKVAIIGSGPAGLTAAFYLAKLGHSVTVFEALPQTGGMMRVGIPAYRLPREILDAEIDEIRKAGVEIKVNQRIESIDDLLQQGFNAVFVGIGDHKGSKMGAEGEDLPAVLDGVDFLRTVALGQQFKIGKKVAIIGGGNSAIDCARVALRVGSSDVTIVYRRTRAEMPAAPEEVEAAIHEGIKIVFLAAPNKITQQGDRLAMECIKMRLGDPDASGRRSPVRIPGSEYVEEFDNVIAGIGQVSDIPAKFDLAVNRGNIKASDKTLETSRKGVFAGGDIVTGPASVIGAIAQGRLAASSIDKYLGGKGQIEEQLAPIEEMEPWFGEEPGFAAKKQPAMPELEKSKSLGGFAEVELGYGEQAAVDEAKRCYKCHYRLRLSHPPVPPVRVKSA